MRGPFCCGRGRKGPLGADGVHQIVGVKVLENQGIDVGYAVNDLSSSLELLFFGFGHLLLPFSFLGGSNDGIHILSMKNKYPQNKLKYDII